MDITVTLTGSGDPKLPDGSTLVFANAISWCISTPSDVEQIGCADAGCEGCTAVHHRFTGSSHLSVEATGGERARWQIPAQAGT